MAETTISCRLAAREYRAQGWSVIPLCHPEHDGPHWRDHRCNKDRRGKAPMMRWSEYQARLPDEDDIERWWQAFPTANVGIVMGAVSNLVGWDIDDPAGEDYLAKLIGGPLPPTLEFLTGGGGRRLLFSWSGVRLPPPAHFATVGHNLTFLGDKSQTVAPPSLHQSGRRYQWKPGHGPGEMELAPAPLAMVVALQSRRRKNSERGGGQGPAPRNGKPAAGAKAEKRGRGMAAKWEPAVEGSGGRVVAFTLACALVHGLGLHVDAALCIMLEEWNQRCVPPWSEDELRERVQSAADTGSYDPIPERPLPTASTSSPAPTVPATPAPDAPGQEVFGGEVFGRTAATVTPAPVEWLIEPWVARKQLTLIAGQPGTGKSTFGAWLVSHAKRPIILPGCEEDPGMMLVPRLLAHGVKLSDVLLLDTMEWVFGRDRERLIRAVRQHQADLIWLDPLDNYMGEADEDLGGPVRRYLESLFHVARETGAAIVGVRHPGKDPRNLLPGSRHWRTVPRMVLELLHDEGPPVRRVCRPHKDSLGREAPARFYDLVGAPGKPRVWTWGKEAPEMEVDIIRSNPDRIERHKIEDAIELIEGMLAREEIEISAIYSAGEKERIGDRCIRRAGERIGVLKRREGNGRDHRCYWRLPPGYRVTLASREG